MILFQVSYENRDGEPKKADICIRHKTTSYEQHAREVLVKRFGFADKIEVEKFFHHA